MRLFLGYLKLVSESLVKLMANTELSKDFGPVTRLTSWAKIEKLGSEFKAKHIRDLFANDQKRAEKFTFVAPNVTVDFSRQRLDQEVLNSLIDLAVERNLESMRDAMFAGKRINTTEDRSVLHTALRLPANSELIVDNQNVVTDVHEVLGRMSRLADDVRSGAWRGATGKRIRHVVNIGIGGSDLGPVMAYEALRPFVTSEIEFYFVSNVDGSDLTEVLKQIELSETLFIVASKTFSTQETMLNATSARSALLAELADLDASVTAKHFVAVSTNQERVTAFGIDAANMFGFWDWVGGRYSMDSAIGLSTMIAIGPDNFMEMLAGFREMDTHFKETPLNQNLPVLLGLIGVWNRSLLEIPTVAVLPYDQYLKRFPAYLQQLIMESNGKSVTKSGEPVEVNTGAIYWGEPGTNGQHSFYQLLHQGTAQVACEIFISAKSQNSLTDHHDALVSNALAQASVFAFGRSADELVAKQVPAELVAHKVMPGNRPTTLFTTMEINPRTLGSLVALYEHMVFVQGIIWGINSFDQWGVELGKEMANSISPYLLNDESLEDFDQATKQAITWYRNNRNK